VSALLMYPLSTLGGCRQAATAADAEAPKPYCPSCGRYLEDSLPVTVDDRAVVVDCPEGNCAATSLLGELVDDTEREPLADILWPRITELEQRLSEKTRTLDAVTAGRAALLADPRVSLRLQALAGRIDGAEAEDLRGLLVALGIRLTVVSNG